MMKIPQNPEKFRKNFKKMPCMAFIFKIFVQYTVLEWVLYPTHAPMIKLVIYTHCMKIK